MASEVRKPFLLFSTKRFCGRRCIAFQGLEPLSISFHLNTAHSQFGECIKRVKKIAEEPKTNKLVLMSVRVSLQQLGQVRNFKLQT